MRSRNISGRRRQDINKGYNKIFRNDKKGDSGGIIIACINEFDNIAVEVHKYNNTLQSLRISLDNTKITIRIGVIYAPQESRSLKKIK